MPRRRNGVLPSRVHGRNLPTDEESQHQLVEATVESLELVTNLDDAGLSDADIVIEAVVENLKVKQKLFTELEARETPGFIVNRLLNPTWPTRCVWRKGNAPGH
ncbi:hypothetical protein niasHS_001888 [Heterodera schachtii]|uniref:3-hydroxyacyl-CoA dehydrogenase NAD binding domain-containing protein n=1 Tax=Heterodera schachtii TaxID=97005 RepID=A0ABD2KAL3_HETSC